MDQTYKRPDIYQDRFNSDPERSYTIPAKMYFDPVVLDDEKHAIFHKSWLYVCHISELATPGAYVTAEIAGQRIFIIHSKDGELKAFFNVCQHRGHALLTGKGTAKPLISCPYHAWAFDHDGTLQAAPNCEAVVDFDKADFNLPAIKLDNFAGFIFVNFDSDARPMNEVYAGAEDMLRDYCSASDDLHPTREVVFDIKGNWKNVGDNLLECYHCSASHKAFVDLVNMQSYKVELNDYWSVQYGGCRSCNSAYNFADDADDKRFMTLFLWPCVAFIAFPGTHGLASFFFSPLTPELTHQVFTYHAPQAECTTTENAAFEYFQDVLGPEDVDLVESVQTGLHSLGYHQGRFIIDSARSQISEHACHHFQNLVMQELGLLKTQPKR